MTARPPERCDGSASAGRTALLLCAVWLALAGGQTLRLAATGSLMSGDGVYHFAHLHSLVVDRDLDPVNEIAHFRDVRSGLTGGPKLGDDTPRNPRTGELVNKYPIGLALLTAPAYVTAYVLCSGAAAAGIPADVSGYGPIYQLAAGLMVAAYAVFGLWCCQRAAISGGAVTGADGWTATLLVAGATPWLFYTTAEPLFSHALSASIAAALVWQWLRARGSDDATPWALAGGLAGLAAITRYQDATLLLLPLADLALATRPAGIRLRLSGVVVAAAGLAASPQLIANALSYGSPLTTGYFGESFAIWQRPWLLYTLVSADVGLLRWSPVVGVAMAGLLIGALQRAVVARAGLAITALQIYLVASWYFVSQGHAFGNRMLLNCTVFFVAGLAVVFSTLRQRSGVRRALLVMSVALVAANVLLMGLWAGGIIGPLAPAGG